LKIAFDENVPAAMLRMFQGFHNERALKHLVDGIELVKAQSYYPRAGDKDYRRSDDPWIRRFAVDGGKVILSGDGKMLQRQHEKLALKECGMVAVFLPGKWSTWKLCQKASLLLHWWPVIVSEVRNYEQGFYRVPKAWPVDGTMNLVRIADADLKMQKIEQQKSLQTSVQKVRKGREPLSGTPDMFQATRTADGGTTEIK